MLDEAHWGIAKGGRVDQIVNNKLSPHPNVIFLCITATPYNLLISGEESFYTNNVIDWKSVCVEKVIVYS